MNHCHIIFKCATLALIIATVGLTGCQQTSPTARNHNSLFDFSQRPRFFGENAVQNTLPQLPQVANAGGSGLKNPLAGIGAQTPNQTSGIRPFGGLFSDFGKQPTPAAPVANNVIPTSSPQQFQQLSQYANQVNTLNQRASAFDSDNQLLNTEVAGLKQKLELANQYNQTLKEQLADTSGRIQQSEIERNKAIAQADQFKRQVAAVQQQGQSPNINQGQFAQASSSATTTMAASRRLAASAERSLRKPRQLQRSR